MMQDRIIGLKKELTQNFKIEESETKIIYSYSCRAKAVYGLGERYCSVNHKGKTLVNKVFEQFTRQNENTYFPLPFYHANDGHGVFVDTLCEVVFCFGEEENRIEIARDACHRIHFYYGSAKEIISRFIEETGEPVLPPKWAFGVWASANRWNCQNHIEEQMRVIGEKKYPVSVIVIEAWSDEATFYIWNGAKYENGAGDRSLSYKDFSFNEPWPDPMGMIDQIHKRGIKIVLWQIPALKLLEEGRVCGQHDADCIYAEDEGFVVKDANGNPYHIPKQWFIGAMLPDFSNPAAAAWWRGKRKYLLEEMQIDGFKTDGGEFIHDAETYFYGNYDGREGRNAYPAQYEEVYQSLIGEGRILFSRAGYTGAQKTPMHWAGDQVSSFEELGSVLNAGLSLSLSGIPFWSFDIGGFAGPLPDKELYLRATALAAFVPAMQWHSEATDGQFADIMKGCGEINDRSPWNMAEVWKDETIMDTARFFANMHMNFLPYFYSEAKRAVKRHTPFMRHLTLDYTEEQAAYCDDEYMIGDILVAPIIKQGKYSRSIYLPEGIWYDMWSGSRIEGGQTVDKAAELDCIPLYLRENGAIVVNLDDTLKLGGYVSGQTEEYTNLCLIYAGKKAEYYFEDDLGNKFMWRHGEPSADICEIRIMSIEEFSCCGQ